MRPDDDDASTGSHGRVVTFYSFKGGVGRSMALANVAWNLAERHALRVIVVDWDLEAPGLHRFFGLSDDYLRNSLGVLDFLTEWSGRRAQHVDVVPRVAAYVKQLRGVDEKTSTHRAGPGGARATADAAALAARAPTTTPRHGSIAILTAGSRGRKSGRDGYVRKLWRLDWTKFYKRHAGREALRAFRDQLAAAADVVLIDSRTGLTDIGGICTLALPDGVVLFTSASEQSWEGTVFTAKSIHREGARAGRDTRVWVCVSRIPLVGEQQLTEAWFQGHDDKFATSVKDGLWRDEDHPKGLRTFRIPHSGRWTIGEQILTAAPTDDLLARAYSDLTEALAVWLKGIDPAAAIAPQDLPELETAVAVDDERGDLTCLARRLVLLARTQLGVGRLDEAAATLERSRGLAEGRGDRRAWILSLALLADVRLKQQRPADAEPLARRAAAVMQQGNDVAAIRAALQRVGVDPER